MADTNNSPRLPLAGVRVLDLSRVVAGPMCTQALGDLGAEVIKVEHPGRGDDTRDWGLPVGTRNTAYFNSANRNKQSIGIDLQKPDGQRIARELAAIGRSSASPDRCLASKPFAARAFSLAASG